MSFFDWFKKAFTWVQRAVKVVEQYVPEEVLSEAERAVLHAAETFVDNDKRREFVVGFLVSKFGISESIARLATELAVGIVKKGLN